MRGEGAKRTRDRPLPRSVRCATGMLLTAISPLGTVASRSNVAR